MRIHELTPETSYVLDAVAPGVTSRNLNSLIGKYQLSQRKRHRYCFHQSPEVDLHDIIICYDSSSYIPPNKHIGKVESLLVIDGEIDFFLFNDIGQVYDYRKLSTYESSCPFYLRVPPNTWHGLRAVGSKPCIIKETISGPYDSTSLQWAPFAPTEDGENSAGHSWYDQIYAECLEKNIASPVHEVYEQISETVFRSSRQLVTVSSEQLSPIITAAQTSPLKRARLCCHNGSEEKLQEMFIALSPGVDIEESMHLRKDESLTVINGHGRYLFPNEDGSLRLERDLCSYSDVSDSDKYFFTRINRYVPHKILVECSTLLIHEATSGPFLKSDTDYRIKGIQQ
jgi:cupin fold WbuC family metalloprotein